MSNLKYALDQLHSKLQEEKNQEIREALKRFLNCDDEMKGVMLHNTGFKGDVTFEKIRDHFETLGLLGYLDSAIYKMELENYRKDNE
ncbi:TPA: hypothetical protein L3N15_004139 [Vibrio parahaemolyticus]|nr:hypothetical protein [Vibrio parahaemolyticus]